MCAAGAGLGGGGGGDGENAKGGSGPRRPGTSAVASTVTQPFDRARLCLRWGAPPWDKRQSVHSALLAASLPNHLHGNCPDYRGSVSSSSRCSGRRSSCGGYAWDVCQSLVSSFLTWLLPLLIGEASPSFLFRLLLAVVVLLLLSIKRDFVSPFPDVYFHAFDLNSSEVTAYDKARVTNLSEPVSNLIDTQIFSIGCDLHVITKDTDVCDDMCQHDQQ